jgi:hypothetical protein
MQMNGKQDTDVFESERKFHVLSSSTSNSSHYEIMPSINRTLFFRKQTSREYDWNKLQVNVMEWFASKNIVAGSP